MTTTLTIGPLTFYNAELVDHGQRVRCYVSSSAVLASDDVIENDGRAVVMDVRTWEGLVESQQAQRRAA